MDNKAKDVFFTARLDQETAEKMSFISDFYGRSRNGQISWLCRQCVAEFEKEHGEITDPAKL